MPEREGSTKDPEARSCALRSLWTGGGTGEWMVVGMGPSSTPFSDVSDTIALTATMQSDKRWDDYPHRDKLSQGV